MLPVPTLGEYYEQTAQRGDAGGGRSSLPSGMQQRRRIDHADRSNQRRGARCNGDGKTERITRTNCNTNGSSDGRTNCSSNGNTNCSSNCDTGTSADGDSGADSDSDAYSCGAYHCGSGGSADTHLHRPSSVGRTLLPAVRLQQHGAVSG